MTLLPRSLSGRMALLIAILVILSQLLSVVLLRIYYVGSRWERAAQALGVQLKNVQLVWKLVPVPLHEKLIREMRQRHHIEMLSPDAFPGFSAPEGRRARNFEQQLRAQFDHPIDIRWQPTRLWIRLRDDAAAPWIGVPRAPFELNLLGPIATWLFIGGICGLIGALWLARRINQPLRTLAMAATHVGKEQIPLDLPETGPYEIAAVSRAFNEMARAVQRLTAERTQLLAGVSHDLRTPLARLRLAIELLPNTQDRFGMIQDINDMDGIIGQFLAFVRGGEDERPQAGDLNVLINEVCARYQRHGHPVEQHLAPLPEMLLRPVAMQRLLGNLIDNALCHGGGQVEVHSHVVNGAVILSVLDRGPGPLQDGATSPPHTGEKGRSTRLGLIIVERIAHLHQGWIQLLPREGGGMEARVVVPIPR